MKLLIVVLAVSIGFSSANLLDNIKDSFNAVLGAVQQTGKDFVPYAGSVGKDLLKTVENDTISIVGGTVANLIGDGLSKLFHLGKRDSHQLGEKTKQLMFELKNLLHLGTTQYSQVIDSVFGQVNEIATHLSELNIHPLTAIKQLEDLVAKHTSLNKEFLEAIERDVSSLVNNVFHKNKRNAFTDTVSSLGTAIATAFKPALNGVSQLLSQAKDFITSVAKNILNAAKSSIATMGGQLMTQVQSVTGQFQQLKTNGMDAFSAVKDAVTDMLKQA